MSDNIDMDTSNFVRRVLLHRNEALRSFYAFFTHFALSKCRVLLVAHFPSLIQATYNLISKITMTLFHWIIHFLYPVKFGPNYVAVPFWNIYTQFSTPNNYYVRLIFEFMYIIFWRQQHITT
jgi:hypothetical protein